MSNLKYALVLLPFSSQEKVEDAPWRRLGDEFLDIAANEDLTPKSPLLRGEGNFVQMIDHCAFLSPP